MQKSMSKGEFRKLLDSLPHFRTIQEGHKFLDNFDKESLIPNPYLQYREGGKIFQTIGYVVMNSVRGPQFSMLSVCVNHTPDSKYSGKDIREMERKNGVGRPVSE